MKSCFVNYCYLGFHDQCPAGRVYRKTLGSSQIYTVKVQPILHNIHTTELKTAICLCLQTMQQEMTKTSRCGQHFVLYYFGPIW